MSSENHHRDATSGNDEGSGDSGDSRFGTQQGHIEGPSNDEAPTAAREDDQQQAAATTHMQLYERASSDIPHGDIDNTTNETRTHFGSSMLNAAGNNRRYNSRQLDSTSLASHSSRQEDRGESYTNDQAAAETLVNL